ncbi:MAG: pyruvoyl-dependent arginine decarboxylase [Planctomycetota bacterium]|jgi:arginine decarboxylase
MDGLVPAKVFLTKGVGQHKYQLKSFEQALRQAGVAQQNLVQVSSILPPKCKIISRESGLKTLVPGQISYCVMARSDTSEHGRLVASSIGVAIPRDGNRWGYLSEVHGHGMNSRQAEDMAEDLAAGMLGTTLGLELDPDKAWSEKEQAYQASGLFIRTTNITQTARGQKDLWTTTVALAMFLFE